jgi:predicted O-methyltransferase YrrM
LNKIDERLALERRQDPGFCAGSSSSLNLRALYILCRTLKPNNVVETGVASGTSSWALLAALERNGGGKLYSIDLPPSQWKIGKSTYAKIDHVSLPQQRSPGWLVPRDLRHRWDLILGESEVHLGPLLHRLGRIDFFHHDAEHTREAMLREFREAWPHLVDGGILSSDDVTWNTAFMEFISEVGSARNSGRWFDFGVMRRRIS